MRQHHPVLKVWRVLYPPLLHYGLLIGINIVAAFFFMFLAMAGSTGDFNEAMDTTMDMMVKNTVLVTALAAVIAIPLLLLFFSRDKKRGQIRIPSQEEQMGAGDWLLVLIITGTAGLALNNLISLSGIAEHSEAFEMANEALFSAGFAMQVIGIGILVPIAEELVFRGLCYNRLKGYAGMRVAVVLTSFGFGVYHGNIVQGIFAFALSALFILIYEKTGRFMTAVAGHITVNMTSVLISEFSLGDWMYKNYFNFFLATGALICVSIMAYLILKHRINRE